jgi:glycosyltransferase involved in cell wall biosynthesis
MLEAFLCVEIVCAGFQLFLMGDGPDLNKIQDSIKGFQLDGYVTILPFNADIVQNARFTVLTSHYEGFPMSMVESLALGTPVVTVDCNSGPRVID